MIADNALLEAASDVLVQIADGSESARDLAHLLEDRISSLFHAVTSLHPPVWWKAFSEEFGKAPLLLILAQITLGRGLSSSEMADVLGTTDRSVRRWLHKLPLVTIVGSEGTRHDRRRVRYVLVPPPRRRPGSSELQEGRRLRIARNDDDGSPRYQPNLE